MIYSSRILRHSRKEDLKILVRCFTHHARTSVNHTDDVCSSSQLGLGPGDKHRTSRFPISGSYSPSCQSSNQRTISTVRMNKGSILWMSRKGHFTSIQLVNKSHQRNFIRCFSTDAGLPTHQEIGMPSLSPTMAEACVIHFHCSPSHGNIARWLKKEGEKLSPGDVLCEVETDKATVEMECMEEGYLAKIVLGDGSTGIKVGEIIAITVEEEEDIAKLKDYTPSTSDTAATPKEPSPPTPPKEEIPEVVASSTAGVTSLLAKDENVPLSNTRGTRPDGSVAKADIKDHSASSGKVVSPASDHTDIPQTQIRKVTASRLLQSKQTIPHYYLTVDTCVEKLMELRYHLNSLQEASGGKRISVNDLVIKAAALALREVPQCNSSWTADYIRQYHNVNINVAVQTDNGLCVPVIKDADKKGLSRIAEEVRHLAQKARDNSLKPEDYEGGTFTVSNLGGPFGIEQFRAIVNPPQSGILAVGSAEKRVVPGSAPNQYEFASFMAATLSCDHRVVDGAIGAEWLKAFKGYIENPQSMLI